MRVKDFLLTTDEIVEILTADNNNGEEELQLNKKDVQILEKNMNEGKSEVRSYRESNRKRCEDAFVNQNFSEKDKTNDFCIKSAENCKWTKIIKEPKAVKFQKQHLLKKLCEIMQKLRSFTI